MARGLSPQPERIKMNEKQYRLCVLEAMNYDDQDAYVSDLALSSIWGDAPDAEIPDDRLRQISSVYTAIHRSVKQIASASDMSQRKLAERFLIPYRTMEDWCSGKSKCPVYTRLMMQECLGLLKR